MDNERYWERIIEVVRLLAEQNKIDVPNQLLVSTGSVWERNRQRRAALNEVLAQIPGLPEFSTDQPLEEIADVLDLHALTEAASSSSTQPRRRRKPVEASEEPNEPAV
jgi:hypothetical protein